MDMFEEAVLRYLCGPRERFVTSQFAIPYEHEGSTGGTCPDFVVLDFLDRMVFVVEVTSASNKKVVMARIADRERRWLQPLRKYFKQLNPIFADWDYHVTVFVRGEEYEDACKHVCNVPDVSVLSLDSVVFSWRWEWEGAWPKNRLRDPAK